MTVIWEDRGGSEIVRCSVYLIVYVVMMAIDVARDHVRTIARGDITVRTGGEDLDLGYDFMSFG